MPKGVCSACGGRVAVRKDGNVRMHRLRWLADTPRGPVRGMAICLGSDRRPASA